ncbi:MAG: T9SS type A sorting domain-containing protein, partial [Bacteroidales bacterium]|nr:T9SS type A sorting domain-containing protein [Bacteroidales bacterium]
ELISIAEASDERSSTMAKGVLCFFYDICYDIEIMGDEIATPRSHSSSNTDVKAVDVQVFPNPVDDNLTVFLSELPEGDLVFQLFDPMGRNLISQPLTDHYTTVNLNKLSPGLYYYRVLNDGIPMGSDKVVKR